MWGEKYLSAESSCLQKVKDLLGRLKLSSLKRSANTDNLGVLRHRETKFLVCTKRHNTT